MPRKKSQFHRVEPSVSMVIIGITFLGIGFVIGWTGYPYLRNLMPETIRGHPVYHQVPACTGDYPEGFFPVTGHVKGNPLSNSTVFLYPVPDTDRKTVLATIRNSTPIRNVSLNATRGFKMDCISPGNYALVLPDTSFDGPIGAPTPEEWTRNNYSLNISLLGYDFDFLVGAFSITRIYGEQNMEETTEETKE